MKKWLALLAVALFCVGGGCLIRAQAQDTIIGGGVTGMFKPSGGGGYSGPGDAISGAKTFWSCARAYNAAYASGAGNMCIIADVATGTTTCTMKAAASGFADLTSSLCGGGTQTVSAFCTAHTSCVVTQMYDQSGANLCASGTAHCDIAQATLANMPALTLSALNSLPCVSFGGTSTLSSSNNVSLAQPMTFLVVSKRTGNFTTATNIIADSGGSVAPFYDSSANTVKMWGGSATAGVTASDNTFHGMQFVLNSTSSVINVDNSGTSVSTGTNSISSTDWLLGSTSLIATACEVGVYGSAFTSGNQSTMFSNMNGSSGYNGGL